MEAVAAVANAAVDQWNQLNHPGASTMSGGVGDGMGSQFRRKHFQQTQDTTVGPAETVLDYVLTPASV